MMGIDRSFARRRLTLPGQFLLAGAVVMVFAMAIVGGWVAKRIEDAVVQNYGISAALFMESFISPLGQELADTETLSPPARQALAEIFSGTALGERVVSYKIWLPDGRIVHASDAALNDRRFPISDDLAEAVEGQISASFEELDELESEAEAALGVPLLEVYSPIREVWTGEIIAVAEFYERADGLAVDLRAAQRNGWLVVGGAFLASGLILFGIVQAGGRTIRQQQERLSTQLAETERVSRLNAALRNRAVAASSRATAQTERAIRRIGFDLHDGPAQYLSLASLRMESAFAGARTDSADVGLVRSALSKALEELRIISRGLALPDLDELAVADLARRAVDDHTKQTEMKVRLTLPEVDMPPLNYAQKLCIFRFLQEALSNATRHGDANEAEVDIRWDGSAIVAEVHDLGKGFDPSAPRPMREDGGQGLHGLEDRAESIGGHLAIESSLGKGTRVRLSLPHEETEQ